MCHTRWRLRSGSPEDAAAAATAAPAVAAAASTGAATAEALRDVIATRSCSSPLTPLAACAARFSARCFDLRSSSSQSASIAPPSACHLARSRLLRLSRRAARSQRLVAKERSFTTICTSGRPTPKRTALGPAAVTGCSRCAMGARCGCCGASLRRLTVDRGCASPVASLSVSSRPSVGLSGVTSG